MFDIFLQKCQVVGEAMLRCGVDEGAGGLAASRLGVYSLVVYEKIEPGGLEARATDFARWGPLTCSLRKLIEDPST